MGSWRGNRMATVYIALGLIAIKEAVAATRGTLPSASSHDHLRRCGIN
jgi:hypothetical protein